MHRKDLLGGNVKTAYFPAFGTTDISKQVPVFLAEFACKITKLSLVPQAAVTGQDTNTRHLNLINKGAAGSGTTELTSYDLTNGNDLSAMDEYVIYNPAAPLDLPANTVLALEGEKIGTGLATPEMLVQVEFLGS